jgi:hypothetical protein
LADRTGAPKASKARQKATRAPCRSDSLRADDAFPDGKPILIQLHEMPRRRKFAAQQAANALNIFRAGVRNGILRWILYEIGTNIHAATFACETIIGNTEDRIGRAH